MPHWLFSCPRRLTWSGPRSSGIQIQLDLRDPHNTLRTMRFTLLALALLFNITTWALEDTPENRREQAQRYLEATPPKEMFADMAEQVAKTLPPEEREEYKRLLMEHLDIDALSKAMVDAMVKHFTADELKALADFYGSPVGKSAMKKFGAFMAEMMPTMQGELVKAMGKANAEKP